MYAIIEDSGQQFMVSEGETLRVDLRSAEAGAPLAFERVLLVSDGQTVKVGTPLVEGAKVLAEVVEPTAAGEKLTHFQYRRRKGYRRKIGHRQKYTDVRITQIVS